MSQWMMMIGFMVVMFIWLALLQAQISHLQDENAALRQQNHRLETEVRRLNGYGETGESWGCGSVLLLLLIVGFLLYIILT